MNEKDYGIVYYEGRHYYELNLVERDRALQNSSPLFMQLGDIRIDEHSWGRLLEALAINLIQSRNIDVDLCLRFRLDWTDAPLFTTNKRGPAHLGPLPNGLYINTNHTSLHLCWIVQDLLKEFSVDLSECRLIVRRSPEMERREVREFYIAKVKTLFSEYLKESSTEAKADLVRQLDIVIGLDKAFHRFSPSFYSLFSFESGQTFSHYKKDFIESIRRIGSITDQSLLRYEAALNSLSKFYWKIYKY